MAIRLTPALLRRGFEIFVLISLVGFGVTLFYGRKDPGAWLAAIGQIRWEWLLVGVGVAALDWVGGGLRLWVCVREVYPKPPLGGMILAGGMGAWAAYLTPLNSGAAPMMMYTMKRYGVPLPVGVTATFITFVATVLFFAIAGPLAILLGGGRSLGAKNALLGLSLYDVFLGTIWIFAGLGLLFLVVIFFPGVARDGLHRLTGAIGRRHPRLQERLAHLERGIDSAHRSVQAFATPRGMLALLWATLLSGPSHGNKLLAGYVAMRALGIEAHFVDVLLLQTMITFLLYFAPTPGASGIGEVLSALIMASYIPRPLTPLYTLIWRCILSYFTIAAGAVVFSSWVRRGLKAIEEEPDAEPAPAG